MSTQCGSCGTFLKQPATGRKREYCDERCKARAKRKREREADRESRRQAAEVLADGEETGTPAAGAVCHVCGREPATIGNPDPLICGTCSARGKAAVSA